ncbi:Hsp33 protein [Planoprotostelium fungivorum]|uniref:Hsp33 protein n=1 Tax=Planoprotostelium fungivorum TaxID=1890364 RepID=A0A2P6NG91_9EUKA|nr:Hsp33 protein [Planoprotostelium fungivorum]
MLKLRSQSLRLYPHEIKSTFLRRFSQPSEFAKHRLREPDLAQQSFTKNLRFVILRNKNTVQTAVDKHALLDRPVEATLLGQVLTGAAIMSSMLHGEERVKLMFSYDSLKIKTIEAEAIQVGEVRGYIDTAQPDVEGTEGGVLTVSKVLYGLQQPVTSSVETSDSVQSSLQKYFEQSEQVPTAINLETKIEEGIVSYSGGIIVQTLPFADPSLIEGITERLRQQRLVRNLYTMSIEEVLSSLLPKDELASVSEIQKTRLDKATAAVATINALQLDELIASEQNIEVHCHYCNTYHVIDKQKLRLSQLQLAQQWPHGSRLLWLYIKFWKSDYFSDKATHRMVRGMSNFTLMPATSWINWTVDQNGVVPTMTRTSWTWVKEAATLKHPPICFVA